MKRALLKKLLITATAAFTATAIIFGEGKAMSVYADDGTPDLVAYDINGDGDDEEVYKLENADDLYWFAGLVNGTLEGVGQKRYANAFLANDIMVNNGVLDEDGELNEADKDNFKVWTPIGNYDDEDKNSYYCGTFDGAGYTISGLYFNDSNKDKVGLFGYVGPASGDNRIKNLTVADSYFCGKESVGGVCGYNNSVIIQNCTNTATVKGSDNVGGVCGIIHKKSIENCYNAGKVCGTEHVGGVCGYSDEKNIIQNCYNTGAVSGNNYAGGICGRANHTLTIPLMIANCYNTGAVSGTTHVGGICGCASSKSIQNCHYLKTNDLKGNGDLKNDVAGSTEVKSSEQFASGEVCWLLNGGEEQADNPAFFQNLDADPDSDIAPVLDSTHSKVYLSSHCVVYSNTDFKEHSPSFSKRVDATCVKDGCEAYWYCTDCKKCFSDENCTDEIEDFDAWKSGDGKIEALGHKYAEAWSSDGKNHWHECSVCHDKKDVTAHTLVTSKTYAGINKDGKLETTCSVCKHVVKTEPIPAIASVKLSKTAYTYNKKAQKPSVIVTDSKGKVIASTNYTVKYPSGRKKIGKYTVTVTFKGNYTGSAKLSFAINPPKTSISKIKAGKKSFTVNWSKKTSDITGYQIEYSTSSKFTGKTKTVTIKSAKTSSKTINKLAGNKKYYVRIRTYKTVSGKKFYSDWSGKKTVKTKK